MYIDSRLQVSSAQSLSGASGAPSTDIIDLGVAGRLIGPGDPMWWVIVARTGLAGSTPTLDIKVQTDTVEGFGSPTDLLSYPQLAETEFVTGTQIVIPMPFTNERYLRIHYTLGGSGPPTAEVDAWLTNQHPQTWEAGADALAAP